MRVSGDQTDWNMKKKRKIGNGEEREKMKKKEGE